GILELSDLVDAVVAGAVDFADVHVRAEGDLLAGGALEARLHGGARIGAPCRRIGVTHAVERFGEDAGARRLAYAADSGEEERVSHAPGRDGRTKRSADVILTDQVGEAHRAPFSGEDDVTHRGQLNERARFAIARKQATYNDFERNSGFVPASRPPPRGGGVSTARQSRSVI